MAVMVMVIVIVVIVIVDMEVECKKITQNLQLGDSQIAEMRRK